MSISVEIRYTTDRRGVECDWGVIDGAPPPSNNPPFATGPLILVGRQFVQHLIKSGGVGEWRGAAHTIETVDGRTLIHADYGGNRWTWQLHEAHWWDHWPSRVFIGRWPD